MGGGGGGESMVEEIDEHEKWNLEDGLNAYKGGAMNSRMQTKRETMNSRMQTKRETINSRIQTKGEMKKKKRIQAKRETTIQRLNRRMSIINICTKQAIIRTDLKPVSKE